MKKCLQRDKFGRFVKGQNLGKNHPNWKGGKYKTYQGYIVVLQPNHPFCDYAGYVKNSRLVMEKHLGRYLKLEEVVHHRNKIKDDDRIKNLKLFPNESEHQKFHSPKGMPAPKTAYKKGHPCYCTKNQFQKGNTIWKKRKIYSHN